MAKKSLILGAMLICLSATAWGDLQVQGDVFGVWSSGDSVFVEGPIRVPAFKGLAIEPGVVIVLKCSDPIVIEGQLEAWGEPGSPVIIIPTAGWGGFYFHPQNGLDVQTLRYVIIPEDAPEPEYVVRSDNASLVIDFCHFHAARGALDLRTGRLQSRSNYFESSGLYSKTVKICQLENVSECGEPGANKFTGNIVKATVPEGHAGIHEFTAALYIDGSTKICLWENTISTIAPGSTIGAFFGEDADQGASTVELDCCVVAVRSYDGSPKGVFNANEGQVQLRRCVLDVAKVNADNLWRTAGVIASHDAQVNVNSCQITLDSGDLFFVPLSGGQLWVDYLELWSSAGQPESIPEFDLPGLDGADDPIQQIVWGDHVIFGDPQLLRQGEWGEWENAAGVALYYGLSALSPCIDAGDSLFGYDPDHTLPDIGRFYYAQSSNGVPSPSPVVAAVALAPAYPNPFNSTAILPFDLNRSGDVSFRVYDLLGRIVYAFDGGQMVSGHHQVRFSGDGLATGCYLVRLSVDGQPTASQRLMLLK